MVRAAGLMQRIRTAARVRPELFSEIDDGGTEAWQADEGTCPFNFLRALAHSLMLMQPCIREPDGGNMMMKGGSGSQYPSASRVGQCTVVEEAKEVDYLAAFLLPLPPITTALR